MLNLDDIRRRDWVQNNWQYMELTHSPSGQTVTGNTRLEINLHSLYGKLVEQLQIFVAKSGWHPEREASPRDLTEQNANLQAQLDEIKAQFEALQASLGKSVAPVIAKRRGRPPKKKAAAEKATSSKKDPEPDVEQAELERRMLAEQMRPPSDAPASIGGLPGGRRAHGGVVARSEVDWIKP